MRSGPVIYVALDTPDLGRAKALAKALKGAAGGFKLGLEFFSANGPEGIAAMAVEGLPLFLDLKLHDIPNTVAGAVRALTPFRPAYMTLHASGGAAMLKAAADAAAEAGDARPRLLGVTVLTSLDQADLLGLGIAGSPAQQVMRLAALSKSSGLDGVVCSPAEVEMVRKTVGKEFTIAVPGIRPAGSAAGDQKRTLTPREAAKAGADILVIGRPITAAPDPAAAARAIAAELGSPA
jgi:orotidine-5'-phosphate decarboxylase